MPSLLPVNRAHLRFSLPVLLFAGFAPLLRAVGPVPPPPPVVSPSALSPQAGEPTITLPTVQVTSRRIRELDKVIARLEKQIAREKKQVKSGELDRTLNNDKLAGVAAIFGGNSSAHLSAVAASRIGLMEQERAVLESMKLPRTLPQLAELEAELEQLRTTRRNLDDAAKQR